MVYQRLAEALRDSAPRFPMELGIRVSVSDCSLVDGTAPIPEQKMGAGRGTIADWFNPADARLPSLGTPWQEGTLFLMRREYFGLARTADVETIQAARLPLLREEHGMEGPTEGSSEALSPSQSRNGKRSPD